MSKSLIILPSFGIALALTGCAQPTSTNAPVKGVTKLTPSSGPTDPGSPLSADAPQQPAQQRADPSATLTSAQAIDAAKAFCTAAGITTSGQASALFTGLHAPGDISYKYWKPVWEVNLETATVEICDTDGVVTGFEAGQPPKTPGLTPTTGVVMTKDAALAKGTQIVKAAHITETLGDPSASIDTKLTGSVWAIDWPRTSEGHPFADQQVSIALDENTGALKSLAVAFHTPAPASTQPVLTQQQAVDKAQAFLETKTKSPDTPWAKKKAALTWVTPKTFGATAKARPPVLTWRCSFIDSRGGYADIPVDAVTGEVVTSALNYNPS